jgi:hypothetical protein
VWGFRFRFSHHFVTQKFFIWLFLLLWRRETLRRRSQRSSLCGRGTHKWESVVVVIVECGGVWRNERTTTPRTFAFLSWVNYT